MDQGATIRLDRILKAGLNRRQAIGGVAGAATILTIGGASGGRFAGAQDATPEPVAVVIPPTPGEVLIDSLVNPRGFTWSADGTLYVSLGGNGGPSSSIVTVANGETTTIVDGQNSSMSDRGTVEGIADVAFIGDQLYFLLEGAGPGHDLPDTPAGVYSVGADGSATLVADLSTWIADNPVSEPADHEPNGNPFKMVAVDDALWVVSAAQDQVLKVTPAGEISRLVDLTLDGGHQTRTGITPAPGGGFYIPTLSTFPFIDGDAKVTKVEMDGTFSDVWTGLTAATDVVVTEEGTLYAIEMTTGNSMDSAQNPGTGRLVKQTGPDSLEEVVTELNLPIAMRLGADGMLYIAGPAWGSNEGGGWITRIGM